MRPSRLAAALLAGAALVSACGDDDGAGGEDALREPGAVTEPEGVSRPVAGPAGDTGGPADELLTVDAPLVGGGTLDLRSLAGEDLALWFWAPW